MRSSLRKRKEFWALRDISFDITNNEKVGVIGRNGSGKSSLARLCAGSLFPDLGEINTVGSKQLLALGVGFKPEMTGLENIYISASLLGVSTKTIKSMIPEIIQFSELEKFIDEPVRTYSAGMKSKLGFAVSTALRPDILILDETLATGDAAFRKKALTRLEQMVCESGILLMISHNSEQIRRMCDRVIWIDHSRMVIDGPSEIVTRCYDKFCDDEALWKKLGRYPTEDDL